MKITIESTSEIVMLDGVPCRVWMGVTEWNIKVTCFIHRIAVDEDEMPAVQELFRRELREEDEPLKIVFKDIYL